MVSRQPEIFVLAGPNGAGKTTVSGLLLPSELQVKNFVNADFIARGISPHSPASSAIEAGRVMLTRIRELRDRQETFGFESTLASRTFVRFLQQSQGIGYVVHVVYVSLINADLAVHRVRLRVESGGHDIPEATIRRRYRRSLTSFFQLYRSLADGWSVWDNSREQPVAVAHGGACGETVIHDQECWARLSQQIEDR